MHNLFWMTVWYKYQVTSTLDDDIYEYEDFDTESDKCIQLDQPPETR